MDGGASHRREDPVKIVAATLRVDAATAEVGRAFDAAGVSHLLLKGPSFAQWLYDAGDPRGYIDSDLLVPPGHQEQARGVLTGLGFEPRYDRTGLPDWWLEHAHEWWRATDGVWVDLHDALPGAGVDSQAAWAVLTEATDEIIVAGYTARALQVPGRALHVALHAAHHGELWGKTNDDLQRALDRADDSVWRAAAQLARRLEALDAFVVGLRLLPEGAAIADRLALPANRSVEAVLRAGKPVPLALAFEQVAQAEGLRARALILLRKLFPPPGFMRHWYPRAATSRRSLAFAYVYRPVWVLWKALAGWRGWRAARRRV